MKNILLENMFRFGTKNLSEESQQILNKLMEQAPVDGAEPTPQQADAAYKQYLLPMWSTVFKTIAIAAQRTPEQVKSNTILYNWRYPVDELKTKGMQNTYAMGTGAAAFDAEFKKRLTQATNDNAWLANVANQLNALFENAGTNNPSDPARFVQTYIKLKLGPDNKMTMNNGTPGQKFNDGVFYAHTTKAYVQYTINAFQPHMLLEKTTVQS
jgi:hypothetical protein